MQPVLGKRCWRKKVKRTLLNKLIFFVLVCLTIPLALAGTTVQTSTQISALGEAVVISGSCSVSSIAVGLEALLKGKTVWFDQAASGSDNKYSVSFVPPQKGTYTLYAACQGDSSVTSTLCVGTAQECAAQATPPAATPPSGGGGCIPTWKYSDWSFCNATLKQSRIVTDTSSCRKPQKMEARNCTVCEESWTCSGWSECVDSLQQRTCTDDRECGTTVKKPDEQRFCQEEIIPPEISQPLPIQPPPKKPTPPAPAEPSFWEQYGLYVVGIPLALIILALIIWLLFLLLRKRKKLVYDPEEVRLWAKKERATGTSDEDVRQIIGDYTGWSKERIEAILGAPGKFAGK